MVLVEDLTGPVDVDGPAVEPAPWEGRHPLQIGADHPVLGRGGRDRGQTLQLAIGLAPRLRRQAGLLDLAPEVRRGPCPVPFFAQLPLDRPHLLAEVELALLLREALLGLGGDLLAELPHRHLVLQELDHPAELGLHGIELEDLLAHPRLERQHRRDEVDDLTRLGEHLGRRGQLVR